MTVDVKSETVCDDRACELGAGKERKVPFFEKLLAIPEVQVIGCALSIYGCYLYYGFLHEKILKTSYGDENFHYAIFLIMIQCIVNAAGAAVVLFATGQQIRDTVPNRSYALVSLAYLSAMVFSFSALRHMSYPMQVLGKSCKMIPVMLMGVVVRRKKYSWKEYLCVVLITMGVAMFSYKPKAAQGHTSAMGVVLLLLSLFMDGFTGPYQERIVAEHNPTSHQLMFWQNVWAALWLLAACIVSGQLVPGAEFLARHPEALRDIAMFCAMSALGQNFIFYTVRNISALACTTITTTRKFFTLLVSVLYFRHSLNARQLAAVVLVFSGIIGEAVNKYIVKQKKEAEKAKSKSE